MTNTDGLLIGLALPACLPTSSDARVGMIQAMVKRGWAGGADPREAEPPRLAIRTGAANDTPGLSDGLVSARLARFHERTWFSRVSTDPNPAPRAGAISAPLAYLWATTARNAWAGVTSLNAPATSWQQRKAQATNVLGLWAAGVLRSAAREVSAALRRSSSGRPVLARW